MEVIVEGRWTVMMSLPENARSPMAVTVYVVPSCSNVEGTRMAAMVQESLRIVSSRL